MSERILFWNASTTSRLRAVLESVLWVLSIYVVPIFIALVSIAALVLWSDQYPVGGGKPLELRIVDSGPASLTPAQARSQLQSARLTPFFDTQRSEAPVWFGLNVARQADGDVRVEFPSRHGVDLACWDAASLRPLGESSRSGFQGLLEPVKAGFALRLGGKENAVLCRGSFVGPARLTAIAWSDQTLQLILQMLT